ncbi:hypothetical protein Tco_0002905 [Tanacetum coccineum]
MADVNAPVEQAPACDHPLALMNQIALDYMVPIWKSQLYLMAEKSQSNPIYKIAVDILKHTNFFRAFTASSTIPAIYIQQALMTIINLCLMGKTYGFEKPRAPVLQILWGIINRAHIDYAERMCKVTKREVFVDAYPNELITDDIRERLLRCLSSEKVAKHKEYLL